MPSSPRQTVTAHAADPALIARFRNDLAALVAHRTDATDPANAPALTGFLDHIAPALIELGFETEVFAGDGPPFLLASRVEDPALPTVLSYGHGDVIPGMDDAWDQGLSPWNLTERNGRWYGRGVADNKGQFLVNLTALRLVHAARDGKLGFNLHLLLEMGEEIGSPGLEALCATLKPRLGADLFLASDGPRLSADRPTLFLGARGGFGVKLSIKRRKGGRHSGNFGGLLPNPGTELANAISCIIDAKGRLKIEAWKPKFIPEASRDVLRGIAPAGGEFDPDWGEPGLTPAERVFAWSTAEVLAFSCGNPDAPVNAIPPEAHAHLQLRYVAGVEEDRLLPALREHLDAHGFAHVELEASETAFRASNTPVDHPFVAFVAGSLAETAGTPPALLPSLGGSLPNHIFTDTLGLPTVWVPHSYPGCSQHAPNEHLPAAIFPEAIALMAGLWWDIGAANRAELGLA